MGPTGNVSRMHRDASQKQSPLSDALEVGVSQAVSYTHLTLPTIYPV